VVHIALFNSPSIAFATFLTKTSSESFEITVPTSTKVRESIESIASRSFCECLLVMFSHISIVIVCIVSHASYKDMMPLIGQCRTNTHARSYNSPSHFRDAICRFCFSFLLFISLMFVSIASAKASYLHLQPCIYCPYPDCISHALTAVNRNTHS
jgi:hypothetical protein